MTRILQTELLLSFTVLIFQSIEIQAIPNPVIIRIHGKCALICDSDLLPDSTPQMKILGETQTQITRTLGRLVRVDNLGVIAVLCYLKETNQRAIKIVESFTRKSLVRKRTFSIVKNLEDIAIREVSQIEINSTDSLQPTIGITKEENYRYFISCSNNFSIHQTQDLQLVRVLLNGSRIPILMSPFQFSASFSDDGQFVSLNYNHEFLYDPQYFNNSFECSSVDVFSLAEKSVTSEKIVEEWKCDENNIKIQIKSKDLVENARKFECSCLGAFPAPVFVWKNSLGEVVTKGAFINVRNQHLCCVVTQYLKSGEKYNAQICKNVKEYPSTCQEIADKSPLYRSGTFVIKPSKSKMLVYCEINPISREAWIVIQKRLDGSLDFSKSWDEYKNGFGDLSREFWLGNDKLHEITNATTMKIRFDLWDKNDNHKYAEYSTFKISDEKEYYALTVFGYSGDAGDSMKWHNRTQFSTRERDNDPLDINCSAKLGGYAGWWFRDSCHRGNLNGRYLFPGDVGVHGTVWDTFRRWNSLKKTVMKIAYN